MKKIDLTGKNTEELKKDLREEQKGLFDLKVENSLGKLKNGHSIGFKKRHIARLKTQIRNKELLDAR